jgi:flagellar M-ring protein FliF
LAEQGVPKGGGVGLEIFDQASIMGDTDKRIAFLRALEGELQRTISMMDAVESVKVNLVIPQPQLFLQERQPSTASVLLGLKRGMELTRYQIKAIVHLVSRSVEGLRPEDVTLVDTRGRALSDLLADELFIYDADGLGGRGSVLSVQRELERQRENELEGKIHRTLGTVLGIGNVVVGASIVLDLSKEDMTSVTYFPITSDSGQGVLRSRNQMEESYTGQGTPPGGPPGTTTNIPGYTQSAQPVNSEYNKADATSNYEISSQTHNKIASPGQIKRMTASILVNAAILAQNPSHNEESLAAMMKDVVEGFTGYNEARGDKLIVRALHFDTTLKDQMAAELEKDRMWRIAVGSFVALLALLCVIAATVWWLRRRKARAALEVVETETKQRVPTIQEMLTSPDLLAFQGEMAVLEEQLKAYARNNPGEVANLVNEWVSSSDA